MKRHLKGRISLGLAMMLLPLAVPTSLVGQSAGKAADPAHYLDGIKAELAKEWPGNRTINLVFHGHSVPAGYFKTPEVRTLEAYPHLVLAELKKAYPMAVINVIITAIGGENAVQGEKRFAADVLTHKPDVVFIDYALNDRGTGLEQAGEAWASMIRQALTKGVKVVLLTPTPDQSEDLLDSAAPLAARAARIRSLSVEYGVGLVDSFASFQAFAAGGGSLPDLMSQVNHPNAQGHRLVAAEILKLF
jgi:lysophospholipase L1-like esterase